jgi:hypothetical protein
VSTPENKGNDYALEALKLLATLASGVLAFSVTFAKELFGDAKPGGLSLGLLVGSWVLLASAAWLAYAAIGDIAKVIGNSPPGSVAYALSGHDIGDGDERGKARLWLARCAQWTFFSGLVLLIVFGGLNSRNLARQAAPPPAQVPVQGPPTPTTIRIDCTCCSPAGGKGRR